MKIPDIKLAIVIPAYKTIFLRQTLKSVAQQTDKRFTVYVCDDASPENVHSICSEFSALISISYCRFESNLGQHSLTGQWDRCIRLSSEPWIWLFADDDIMSPECVETFYLQYNKNLSCDLYRFNTRTIDADGNTIEVNPAHPPFENNFDFLIAKLNKQRKSFATEYIFSRKVFENNGFEDFPLAWCSDDAAWIKFGKTGIITLSDGIVNWRDSIYNISGQVNRRYKILKAAAAFSFRHWASSFFKQKFEKNPEAKKKFNDAMNFWIRQQIFLYPGIFNIREILDIVSRLHGGKINAVSRLCFANLKLIMRKITAK